MIKTNSKGQEIYPTLTAFNFWECGAIGINVHDDEGNYITCYDLPLDEAYQLVAELNRAIREFNDLEMSIEQLKYQEEPHVRQF
jgi:hypothetical protein